VRTSSTHRSTNKARAASSANRRRVSRKANGHRGPGELRKRSTNEDIQQLPDMTVPNGRDAVQKAPAIAEESSFAMSSYFATAKAVRDVNMQLIEVSQANPMATLN